MNAHGVSRSRSRSLVGRVVDDDPHVPDGCDTGLIGRRTLIESWTRHWSERPSAQVLRDRHVGWMVADEFEDRSRACANHLTRAGVHPGDRVIVSARTSIAMACAHVGALRMGATVVPMNSRYTKREIVHVVSDADPAALVTDDRGVADAFREEARSPVFALDPALPGQLGTDTRAGSGTPGGPIDAASTDDPAMIVYTSGTTGAPKGAVLSHANLQASCESLRIAWRWNETDRLLLALPLFHVHGLGIGLHGTLHAGASAILFDHFDAGAVIAAANAHSATLFFGVPTMYERICRERDARSLSRLRLCVSGSAPLSRDLFESIESAMGQVPLERYGMSETLMNISNPYDGERRPGSVGFALPGVEVELRGENDEIYVRGPNVFGRYWRNDAATTAAFDDDSWFGTGDIGAIDKDGYFRLRARLSELIITNGYNVYPREVEQVLRSHHGVVDAAVVGRASGLRGEDVIAFVETDGRIDDLDEFAASQLARYKRPIDIHVVDALPRNALGKVLKHELSP